MKTINYKFKELHEGQVFGLEEMIQVGMHRCVTAQALTDCELEYLDRERFFERKEVQIDLVVFTPEDISTIKANGNLEYLDPVPVAKEFINYQKAVQR